MFHHYADLFAPIYRCNNYAGNRRLYFLILDLSRMLRFCWNKFTILGGPGSSAVADLLYWTYWCRVILLITTVIVYKTCKVPHDYWLPIVVKGSIREMHILVRTVGIEIRHELEGLRFESSGRQRIFHPQISFNLNLRTIWLWILNIINVWVVFWIDCLMSIGGRYLLNLNTWWFKAYLQKCL